MFHREVESGSFIAKASNAVSVSARLGVEVEMDAEPHVPPSATSFRSSTLHADHCLLDMSGL